VRPEEEIVRHEVEPRARFWRIATAGISFQGGAAAVDTSTIVAALVHGLTGSPFAVGAAAAIARYGWLFPQLIVGWLAQRHRRRLPFYMLGAFGRVVCLAGVAGLLAFVGGRSSAEVTAASATSGTAAALQFLVVRRLRELAQGKETDGNPSLRYITLLREGARVHGLPDHWLRCLDSVKPAE
jgi:hypothetical protein